MASTRPVSPLFVLFEELYSSWLMLHSTKQEIAEMKNVLSLCCLRSSEIQHTSHYPNRHQLHYSAFKWNSTITSPQVTTPI